MLQHHVSGLVFLIDHPDDFFEKSVHAAVDALANVAVPAATTVLINVGGGLSSPLHVELERVPLAESPCLSFSILHELSTKGDLTAGSILNFHSECTKVLRACRFFFLAATVKVVSEMSEVGETGRFHSFTSFSKDSVSNLLNIFPLFD